MRGNALGCVQQDALSGVQGEIIMKTGEVRNECKSYNAVVERVSGLKADRERVSAIVVAVMPTLSGFQTWLFL